MRAIVVDSLRAGARWRDSDQFWDIMATTAWVRQAAGPQEVLLSVILATHNRARVLPRAIDSVLRQVHEGWQLIVVDDMSTDHTRDTIDAYSDHRIQVVSGPGRGPAAARNTGLAAARGDVVAYLDDDNCLDPLWLRGVAWAFARYPDTALLYGARVLLHRSQGEGFMMPELQFPRYRKWWLRRGNFIDVGMIAHRHKGVGVQFDEAIPPPHEDWDLIRRMTKERAPLRLPMISSYYFTDAPNRQSDLGRQHGSFEAESAASGR